MKHDESDEQRSQKLSKLLKSEKPKKEFISPIEDLEEAFLELTEEEKTELEAQARAQVAEELRAQRKKQFLKEQISKYRKIGKPGQKIVPIALDLPGHADKVTLDGTVFFHGALYRVTENVYRTLIDIQARAWEHENEIGGANRDLYKGRKPVNPIVSPHGQINATEQNRIAPMVRF